MKLYKLFLKYDCTQIGKAAGSTSDDDDEMCVVCLDRNQSVR